MLGIIFLTVVVAVHATENADIKNNGQESKSSVVINDGSSTTVKQGNSLNINNNINANASTGNNSTSNNVGNSTIKTGDANVNVNVSNTGNTNNVDPKKTPKPTATVKPTDKPTNPTATPVQDNGGGSNGSGSSTSQNSQGGIGGAEVMGLAATDSGALSKFISFLGFICLVIGSSLISRREHVG